MISAFMRITWPLRYKFHSRCDQYGTINERGQFETWLICFWKLEHKQLGNTPLSLKINDIYDNWHLLESCDHCATNYTLNVTITVRTIISSIWYLNDLHLRNMEMINWKSLISLIWFNRNQKIKKFEFEIYLTSWW